MLRSGLVGRSDADQQGFAENAAHEVHGYRKIDRLGAKELARALAAVGSANHRAGIDFLSEPSRYRDRRMARIRAQPRCERRPQIGDALNGEFVVLTVYDDGTLLLRRLEIY